MGMERVSSWCMCQRAHAVPSLYVRASWSESMVQVSVHVCVVVAGAVGLGTE